MRSLAPAFLFCLLFSNTAFANSEPLYIVLNDGSYPAHFKGRNGWEGIDVDLLKAILSRAGLSYSIINHPFKRTLYELEIGAVHIAPNLVKSRDRLQYMEMLGPVRITSMGLVVRKSDASIEVSDYDDLISLSVERGLKFGMVAGTTFSKSFSQRYDKDPAFRNSFDNSRTIEQVYKKLHSGRILGFIRDDFEMKALLERAQAINDSDYLDFTLSSYRVDGSKEGAYIGISKKLDCGIMNKLKSAYLSILQDGTLEEIHQKWTGEKLPLEVFNHPDNIRLEISPAC